MGKLTVNIGMVTCWYRNISMANYSYNLKASLKKSSLVDVKVVSSPCSCATDKFAGQEDVLQDEECDYVGFPPYVRLSPKKRTSLLLFLPTQILMHLLRGLRYLSKCSSCYIIHYQQSAFSLGILPLVPLMLIPTANKKIITVHTIDRTLGLRFFSERAFLQRVYNRANKIIVHSEDIKNDLVSMGIEGSKITVIPHGVRIPELMHKSRDKITFFGAPTEQKGTFVLFKALKILKEEGNQVVVHFYGIYSASEKDVAEILARELGVNDCIIWGGRLSEYEFDEKMQESMFTFVVHTKPVSGSSTLTRAMANATPIIATDIGGIAEYSGSFGFLIPPNDSRALANAITKLAKNPEMRREMGNTARKEAMKISWDEIARRSLQVYLDVLKN